MSDSNKRGSGSNTMYCTKCVVRFSVMARVVRKWHCPSCGERDSVVKFDNYKHRGFRTRWGTKIEWDDAAVERLKTLHKLGYTYMKIAGIMGVGYHCIKHKCHQMGLKRYNV